MANLKEQKPKGLKEEVIALSAISLGIISAVSLFLYNKEEAGLVGIVGNLIASFLIVVTGKVAYLLPLIFFVIAYKVIRQRNLQFRFGYMVGLFLFIISACGLLELLLPLGDLNGGAVGSFVVKLSQPYLGSFGAGVVMVAILLISFRVGTGLSFIEIIKHIFTYIAAAVTFLRNFSQNMREKSAKKKIETEKLKREKEKSMAVTKPRGGPTIVTQKKKEAEKKTIAPMQEEFTFDNSKTAKAGSFKLPHVNLLKPSTTESGVIDKEAILTNTKILEKKLHDFDIEGHVTEVRPGPVVTMYEFEPATGIKVNKIVNMADDLALAMRAMSIRIEAPIPGKNVVGIEIPNQKREMIVLKDLIATEAFAKSKSVLTIALGKDIAGIPYMADLQKMPHLLIAGSTGAGKSVSVNTMILSILYKSTPDEVRFLMIDPKMLELSVYDGIPHLLSPVITEARKATVMLKSLVGEMNKRYQLMADLGTKNLENYNKALKEKGLKKGEIYEGKSLDGTDTNRLEHKYMPYIVVIIDELADLMMASKKDVEESLVRLSQMARASGIHLVLATQRPSVDVITGLIKANFPARIALKVPSRTDSRTILDTGGAERLLGQGDMLFLPPGSAKLERIQSGFVDEDEIKQVVDNLKKQGKPVYEDNIIEEKTMERAMDEQDLGSEFLGRYDEAVQMAQGVETISTSYIQRRLRIGYNTAARIMEKMEDEGIVGPPRGSKPREVILGKN